MRSVRGLSKVDIVDDSFVPRSTPEMHEVQDEITGEVPGVQLGKYVGLTILD